MMVEMPIQRTPREHVEKSIEALHAAVHRAVKDFEERTGIRPKGIDIIMDRGLVESVKVRFEPSDVEALFQTNG
jgi:hypothetical protein